MLTTSWEPCNNYWSPTNHMIPSGPNHENPDTILSESHCDPINSRSEYYSGNENTKSQLLSNFLLDKLRKFPPPSSSASVSGSGSKNTGAEFNQLPSYYGKVAHPMPLPAVEGNHIELGFMNSFAQYNDFRSFNNFNPPDLPSIGSVYDLNSNNSKISFIVQEEGGPNGFNTDINGKPLPKLQIGSFQIPTYGETDARFTELFRAKIRDVSSTAANAASLSQQTSIETQEPSGKSIFASISTTSTTCGILDEECNIRTSISPSVSFSSKSNSMRSSVMDPIWGFNALPDANNSSNRGFGIADANNSSNRGFGIAFMDEFRNHYRFGDRYPSFPRMTSKDRLIAECNLSKSSSSQSVVPNKFMTPYPGTTASRIPDPTMMANRLPTDMMTSYTDVPMVDLTCRIPLPLSSLLDNTFTSADIEWTQPYTSADLQVHQQLMLFSIVTHDRLLSTFELSVFRSVYCVGNCDHARTPTRCWASHNFGTCTETKRWLRRNPFVYQYKHLLCPKIQSMKDSFKDGHRLDSDNSGLRYSDKLALQQACFKCEDGLNCQYSHSLEEQMYHPFVYKTAICNNQPGCTRPFCPFLHDGEYYTNEAGQLKPKKYDSLAAWNNWKANLRRLTPPGSVTKTNQHSFSFEEYRPSTEIDFESAMEVTQPKEDIVNPLPEREPLDRMTPYNEDPIEPKEAHRFAQELFNDCRKPLQSLELSVFRTTRCPHKSFCPNNKAPTRCWATHASNESNRWLRRNPYVNKYKHLLCPHVRADKNNKDPSMEGRARWLACPKGRHCNLAHSIEEQMYHPFVYKTSRCTNKTCERPFCPFLHDGEEPRPLLHNSIGDLQLANMDGLPNMMVRDESPLPWEPAKSSNEVSDIKKNSRHRAKRQPPKNSKGKRVQP